MTISGILLACIAGVSWLGVDANSRLRVALSYTSHAHPEPNTPIACRAVRCECAA